MLMTLLWSSTGYADESPSSETKIELSVPDCDTYFSKHGRELRLRERGKFYCARTFQTEDKLHELGVFEAECQRDRRLKIRKLKIKSELLAECELNLNIAWDTVQMQEDHTQKMERLGRIKVIKVAIISAIAGLVLGAVIVVVVIIAL